ncbi:MAG TPA: PspC domain-containing protein [Prolixibacteraceae bacterium]|nr:PspC domain-containing protein [Prolixibacteraceae bacterium]
MKKTITINISGTIFHIEEDAYEKLQQYLNKLKNHFGADPEGAEIVSDIEMRICELFLEKGKSESTVVVNEWVDEVIAIMGTPEDFAKEEVVNGQTVTPEKGKKRLYRDPENKIIGGVCSGLAAYFNIDPLVVRILMAILFFANGIGLLAYLVLWIAVPRALTTAQRLEMRGKQVNISNIEQTVRDDNPADKGTASGSKESGTPSKGAKIARQTGDAVSDVFKGLFKATVIALGIFLIFIAFTGLLAFISSLVIGQTFLSDWPVQLNPDFQVTGFLDHFVSRGTVVWGLICIGFLVGIPLLAMLYIGTKLVFNYKSNNTVIGLAMVGVWLIALMTSVVVASHEVSNFKEYTNLSNSETLFPAKGKTLKITMAEDKYAGYIDQHWDLEHFKAVSSGGKDILLGEPRLRIEKSSTGDCVIVVKKQSRGKNREQANDYIQQITYGYQLMDTTLLLDPWFQLGEKNKWKDQRVDITLKIPENMAVYLDEKVDGIIHDIPNVSGTWDHDMIGKTWIMLPDGLTMKDSIK